MPVAWLRAHVAMLRRLEAEDALRMANAVGYGFGGDKDGSYHRSLMDAINDGEPPPKKSPLAAAMALGIPIERVRKKD